MSTPRTDAATVGHHCKAADLCRQLETELQAKDEALKLAKEALLEAQWQRPQQDHLQECPCCHKTLYLHDTKTHYPDCKLALALSKLP